MSYTLPEKFHPFLLGHQSCLYKKSKELRESMNDFLKKPRVFLKKNIRPLSKPLIQL
jgi:hypothetical protein